jgi:hypothetical protein
MKLPVKEFKNVLNISTRSANADVYITAVLITEALVRAASFRDVMFSLRTYAPLACSLLSLLNSNIQIPKLRQH